jgi:hypothetical protein
MVIITPIVYRPRPPSDPREPCYGRPALFTGTAGERGVAPAKAEGAAPIRAALRDPRVDQRVANGPAWCQCCAFCAPRSTKDTGRVTGGQDRGPPASLAGHVARKTSGSGAAGHPARVALQGDAIARSPWPPGHRQVTPACRVRQALATQQSFSSTRLLRFAQWINAAKALFRTRYKP